MAGRFIWCELMTTDLERSTVFFASLLDADVLRPDDGSPALFLAKKGTESILFGLLPIIPAPGVRSHWLGYLTVDDVDRAVAQVREAGGDLHVISDDDESRGPGDPRFAVITDPMGAVLNVHEEVPSPSSEDLPEPGRVAWVELLTSNRDSAASFYRDLVGWEVGPAHERKDEGTAHALFRNERVFGLLRDLPAGSPVPPHWAYYLRVPDLDTAIANVRALGGFMYEDAAQVDGGRRVIMLDPTGAPVCLWASQ